MSSPAACPFCLGPVVVVEIALSKPGAFAAWVECRTCCARGPSRFGRAIVASSAALAIWNAVAAPAAPGPPVANEAAKCENVET